MAVNRRCGVATARVEAIEEESGDTTGGKRNIVIDQGITVHRHEEEVPGTTSAPVPGKSEDEKRDGKQEAKQSKAEPLVYY